MQINSTSTQSTSGRNAQAVEVGMDVRNGKPVQLSNPESSPQKSMSAAEAKEVIESLEAYMNVLQTTIGFRVNDKTDNIVVSVINRETDEVIRQIPPEELLALQEKMQELTGTIFSEKV